MIPFVFDLHDVDATDLSQVGGKGANLGELITIAGIEVPDGFCVSTAAFKNMIDGVALEPLCGLDVADRAKVAKLSAEIRSAIEGAAMASDVHEAIAGALAKFGEQHAYAVRSSATAEDLPTASFAGQQDTYLNVIGKAAIIEHVKKCWASLFTERAVIYRLQNGVDQRSVQLSVVIQKMIFPQVAGVMFTADPVTSNRKVLSIDASFGLGEGLVSGVLNADNYRVCNGEIIDKKIAVKERAIHALKAGGTQTQAVSSQ
jgi:pyruvate,water dikinase